MSRVCIVNLTYTKILSILFVRKRRTKRYTRNDTLYPYTTLFRSSRWPQRWPAQSTPQWRCAMRPSALHTSQVRCVVPEAAALRWWLSCHAFERDRDLDVGWVLHADVPVARESVDDLRLIAAVVEVPGERGTQR